MVNAIVALLKVYGIRTVPLALTMVRLTNCAADTGKGEQWISLLFLTKKYCAATLPNLTDVTPMPMPGPVTTVY